MDMKVLFKDKEGRFRMGTVQILKVSCNKPTCTKCPHGPYRYVFYRDDTGKLKKVYLGRVKDENRNQPRACRPLDVS